MSLLDKTRTELINIILRKDNVEKRLMDKVKLLEKEKKQLIEEIENRRFKDLSDVSWAAESIESLYFGLHYWWL